MANRSLNKVMLIGNLTRDPELRYTPSGVAVCNFGMATNRRWTDAEGGLQESTEFHRLVAWGKLAELCSQLLFKGRKVFIEGRLQTREWTGQDGTKRTTTEVVIDNMLVLDSRRKEEVGVEAVTTPPDEEVKPVEPSGEIPAEKTPAPASASQTKSTKKKTDEKKEEKESASSAKPADTADKEEVKKEDIPF